MSDDERAELKKNRLKEAGERKAKEKEEEKEADNEEGDVEITLPKPKTKVSIEFSRSGIMLISKANVGSMYLASHQQRKASQLNEDLIRQGKARLKWYKERDEDKIKTDIAKNDFESMIYKLRDWLREEENHPFVKEDIREQYIEQLTEMEDWLYEDGADANYTVYNKKAENMTRDYNTYDRLKQEFEVRQTVLERTNEALA
jgi:hypothetical protein